MGIQVIALGDGQFRAVAFMGGLPGNGWNEQAPERIESKLENGQVEFHGEHAAGILVGGEMKIMMEGEEIGKLEKVHRKSETLGKKPPENAVVLFDGSSPDGFVSTKHGPAKMTDDGLLIQGANSKHQFADCHLHIEFQTPYKPAARGQGRGNSGVYLQGRYEVQVLDSFGLTGEQNECGGIYSIKKPGFEHVLPTFCPGRRTISISLRPSLTSKAKRLPTRG